jgi:prefoldin subunit 5
VQLRNRVNPVLAIRQRFLIGFVNVSLQVEKEVNAIHEQIVQVGGGKLKSLQDEANDLDKRIDKINNEVTRLNVAIKTSDRFVNTLCYVHILSCTG